MCYFKLGDFGFYLHDYFVNDWIANSMLFLEVENLSKHHKYISASDLEKTFNNVKISSIKTNTWGIENKYGRKV